MKGLFFEGIKKGDIFEKELTMCPWKIFLNIIDSCDFNAIHWNFFKNRIIVPGNLLTTKISGFISNLLAHDTRLARMAVSFTAAKEPLYLWDKILITVKVKRTRATTGDKGIVFFEIEIKKYSKKRGLFDTVFTTGEAVAFVSKNIRLIKTGIEEEKDEILADKAVM